uniref:Uncharacterized protein n=1 Tax=Salix viminalis TaxID=40686 RepID=A0A6N2MF44_SALVM
MGSLIWFQVRFFETGHFLRYLLDQIPKRLMRFLSWKRKGIVVYRGGFSKLVINYIEVLKNAILVDDSMVSGSMYHDNLTWRITAFSANVRCLPVMLVTSDSYAQMHAQMHHVHVSGSSNLLARVLKDKDSTFEDIVDAYLQYLQARFVMTSVHVLFLFSHAILQKEIKKTKLTVQNATQKRRQYESCSGLWFRIKSILYVVRRRKHGSTIYFFHYEFNFVKMLNIKEKAITCFDLDNGCDIDFESDSSKRNVIICCLYEVVQMTLNSLLDDLIIGLEALGLLANMNWERKEARKILLLGCSGATLLALTGVEESIIQAL